MNHVFNIGGCYPGVGQVCQEAHCDTMDPAGWVNLVVLR